MCDSDSARPASSTIFACVESLGAQLEAGMKDAAHSAGVPVNFRRQGSMFCGYFTDRPVDNLEFALIADGVPMDKIYPIDFDRAFKKLDQIKPHISVWWTTGQQPAQLLLDKEVVLATGWNGRFYDLIKKGGPVEIEWNEGALKQGSFVIPRGAKNAYWGQKMLAEMSVPQQQAIYASELGYPGLNLESLNYVDAKVKPYLPTQYIDKQFWIDDNWYAENGNKAIELWNAWLLKKG